MTGFRSVRVLMWRDRDGRLWAPTTGALPHGWHEVAVCAEVAS